MLHAELYNRDTINSLVWPDTDDGTYGKQYLLPLLANGAQAYVRNAHQTDVFVAKVGNIVLPITVTDFHPDNSFVCSPYSHYISYGGFEEVHRIGNPAIETILRKALHPLAWYLRRSGFDRVVYVNNWLLSTNLYPSLQEEHMRALTEALPQWFPDRAIVFRSVDSCFNPLLYRFLAENRYAMVLSRQVWSQNPDSALRKRDSRSDSRALKQSPYTVVSGDALDDDDLHRGLQLYNYLYLDKYSSYNPQFTFDFLRRSRDEGLLHLRALSHNGRIDGILGYFIRNNVMTTPLLGYDVHRPQTDNLYRILSLLTLQAGREHGITVHASAGVGKFKKNRGGSATIEYNAVYAQHLPRKQQRPWFLMKRITDATIPFFRRYDW